MLIEIKHIAKQYGKRPVLRDITLQVNSGNCIGILGSNGSGKSTLLSILAGTTTCQKGEFLCDGTDLLKDKKLLRNYVGYVPQGTPLLEELTVRDNLLLWYSREKLDRELKQGVLQLLGLESMLHTQVRKLSGGMKKRLSIGCAVANHPPILLLDEPTAALDMACKQTVFQYLQRYKRSGGVLFLVTHEIPDLELCDACYILKNGVPVPFSYDGDPRKLLDSL